MALCALLAGAGAGWADPLYPVTSQSSSTCNSGTAAFEALFDDGTNGGWTSTQPQNPPIGLGAAQNNIGNPLGTTTDVTRVRTVNSGNGVASPSGGGFVGAFDRASFGPAWSSPNLGGVDMRGALNGAVYYELFNYANGDTYEFDNVTPKPPSVPVTYGDTNPDFFIIGNNERLELSVPTPVATLETGAWAKIERALAPGPDWKYVPNGTPGNTSGRRAATLADMTSVLSSVFRFGVWPENIISSDFTTGFNARGVPVTEKNMVFAERFAIDSVKVFDCHEPELEVIKSSGAPTVALGADSTVTDAGDQITYTYTVTNSGDLDLADVSLSETGFGGVGAAPTIAGEALVAPVNSTDAAANGVIDLLAVGEAATFTATYVLQAGDITAGSVQNQATATGNPVDAAGADISYLADVVDRSDNDATGSGTDGVDAAGTGDTTGDDNPTVTLIPQPEIVLTKSIAGVTDSNGNGVFGDVGDTVRYSFTAENTGNVALAGIAVTDAGLSALTGVATGPTALAGFDGDLAAGEGPVQIAEATYVLTATDVAAGQVSNSAAVRATPVASDAGGAPVPGTPLKDGAGVDLANVTDTSDTGSTGAPNQTTGAVPSVADPAATDSDGVSGNDGDEPTVLDLPTLTSEIELVKSVIGFTDVNGSGDLDAGDTVRFGFDATNTGETALARVSVTDSGLPGVTVVPAPAFDGDLAVDEGPVRVATAAYSLTTGDITAGAIENSALISGDPVVTDGSGDPDPATPLVDGSGAALASVEDRSDAGTGPEVQVATGLPATIATPGTVETAAQDGSTDGDAGNDPTVLVLPAAKLELIKSVDSYADTNGDGMVSAGDTVRYSFVVANRGALPVTGISLSDPLAVVTGGPIDLAVGASDSTTFTGAHVLTAANIAAGGFENSATAEGAVKTSGGASVGDPFAPGTALTVQDVSDSGTDRDGSTITAPATVESADFDGVTDGDPGNDPTVFVVDPIAKLRLTKSVAGITDRDGDGQISEGDDVSYSFAVENTGNVALSSVQISDPHGPVTGGPITLGIGATDTTSFGLVYTLRAEDIAAGLIQNSATVQANAVDAAGVGITDAATGQPLTASDLSDSGTSPEIGAAPVPDTVPTPEQTETPDKDGATDNDPTNDPTVLRVPKPALTVVKSVARVLDSNGDGLFGGADDEVVYAFLVTNTGNVDLVGITLTDPLIPVTGGPIDLAAGAGDSLSFGGSYTVTAADIARGYVQNSATVTGAAVTAGGTPIVGLDGAPITVSDVSDSGTAPDLSTIPTPGTTETRDGAGATDGDPGNDPTVIGVPSDPKPALEVVKTVSALIDNGDGVVGAGDTLRYVFEVGNIGNLRMTGITVSDPLVSVTGGPITLDVGATDNSSFAADYVLTAADVAAGGVQNSASVSGAAINGLGDPVMDPATGVQRTATAVSDAGSDPRVGLSGTPTALADPHGAETADLNGQTDGNPGNDPTVFLIPRPDIRLEKALIRAEDSNGDGVFGGLGDQLIYGFVVHNRGAIDLVDVQITDPTATVNGSPISLTAGQDDGHSFTATYTVTGADVTVGSVQNSATVTGLGVHDDGTPYGNAAAPGTQLSVKDVSDSTTDPQGDRITNAEAVETPDQAGATDGDPTNDPTVVLLGQAPHPAVQLVKSVVSIVDTDGDAVVGGVEDAVTYHFTVTNTGATRLVNIAVTDPLLGGRVGVIDSLDVGASQELTAGYALTVADLERGHVDNSATVAGEAVSDSGVPYLNPETGEALTARDISDTGTAADMSEVPDPAATETPDGAGATDGDPTNDPTTVNLPIFEPDTFVSGAVFLDLNGDGVIDDGDQLLPNYTVILREANGDIAATTTSDANGHYEMEGFAVGRLVIEFVDPATGQVVGTIPDLEFTPGTEMTEQNQPVELTAGTGQLGLSKSTTARSVAIGDVVPYLIVVTNPGPNAVRVDVEDRLPYGLLYQPGSGQVDGQAVTPDVSGTTVTFTDVLVPSGGRAEVTLSARVGAAAPSGALTNSALATDPATGLARSAVSTATVTRVADALFDCTHVIGKVFNDRNMNGHQDPVPDPSQDRGITNQDIFADGKKAQSPRGEPGLPGVKLVTPTGTVITTDAQGRYSVPCADIPGRAGANFVLKLDTRSLPTGYRVTTENPRALRLTPGVMAKMNFGAAIGRVVDVDLTGAAFVAGSVQPVDRLEAGLERLLQQVAQTPSVIRVTYYHAGDTAAVIDGRLDAVEAVIRRQWRGIGAYRLIIERSAARME